ncbi:MAG: hypothetical protein DRH43_06050, partial [Deltaproteobacteria bacterium]
VIDDNDTPNDAALGLSLRDVNFGLAMMKKKAPATGSPTDFRSWTSLKAEVGSASFVGIDGLAVSVSDFSVAINQGRGTKNGQPNTTVADFKTTPLIVNTGGGNRVTLDFDGNKGSLLRAAGVLTLVILKDDEEFVSLTGGFSIEKSESTRTVGAQKIKTSKLLIGSAGIDIFLGAGQPGDADAMGVLVENVRFGMVLFKKIDVTNPQSPTPVPNSSKMALSSSGEAALLGIDGLELSGSLGLRKNNTGYTTDLGGGYVVNETINVPDPDNPGQTIPVEVKFKEDVSLALSGTITIKIVDSSTGKEFVSLTGGFSFTKSKQVTGSLITTRIKAGAAGIEAFLGVGPAKIPDDSTPDPGDTKINPDAMGVLITDAKLGLVLFRNTDSLHPANNSSSYALAATGGAMLLGVDDLSLSGSLGVRVNKTGRTVDESVTVPLPGGGTEEVRILFNTTSPEPTFAGTVDLAIADLFTVSGGFAFKKQAQVSGNLTTTKILVGAANINIFLGMNEGTSDEIGVRSEISELGIVLFKNVDSTNPAASTSSYALFGAGSVAFVGLDGLDIDGSVALEINKTQKTVDETINVPNPDFDPDQPAGPSNPEEISVQVKFTTPSEIKAFKGDVTLTVADVFTLSGTIYFRQSADGKVQVNMPTASVLITIDGEEVVGISGSARFSIGDVDGFKLQDMMVTGFSLMGTQAGVAPGTPVSRLPNADLMEPANGAVIDKMDLYNRKYIDIRLNDPNGAGLNEKSITDALPEFTLKGPGNSTLIVNGSPKKIGYNTYRYSLENVTLDKLKLGEWQVEFKANSWSDKGGRRNASEVETFTIREGQKPTANLSNPVSGAQVDLTMLNACKFIDVTFADYSGAGLNEATILDSAPEFTLSGPGVADAAKPYAISGMPQHLYGTTYRYRITDLVPNNGIDLFKAGEVQVNFIAGSWADNASNTNPAEIEKFTVTGTTGSAATTSQGMSIGPVLLQGPTVGIQGLTFKDMKLVVTIGIGVQHAALNFGSSGTSQTPQQSQSGITTDFTGLLGTFDLAVDVLGFLQGSGSIELTGKFGLDVSSFNLQVPNVLLATAEGVKIQYDPSYDPAEHNGESQKLITILKASLSFPKFKISGSIQPYDPDGPSGPEAPIPGLIIRTDGFRFGTAEICYGCTDPQSTTGAPVTPGTTTEPAIKLGSILEFDDIRFGISNFGVTFGEALDFDGEIFIASGGAKFCPGKPVNATIKDSLYAEKINDVVQDPNNTWALRAALSFTDGRVDSFKFYVDTFRVEFGQFLALTGKDLYINTGAADNEEIVSFVSIGAELKVASLRLTGEGRNFAFLGDGTFKAKQGFGVFFGAESATGKSVGWPKWLPIKIKEIGIEWPDINNRPLDFVLSLSASVTGIKGLKGAEFSGVIEGVKIDVGKLFRGEFPILDIASIGVGVSANAFGGKINGTLIGGILKIDENNQVISPFAPPDTPVKDRIFFMGVQGGYEIAGSGGFTIRFALSELGPLGVQVEAVMPIILEPDTGLAITDFVGGVEFFTSLPDISEPKELRDPRFAISVENVDASCWLDQVKQQVVNQYLAAQQNPIMGSFIGAFTSPMTITGACTVYDAYATKMAFNGQVGIKISTDGKILMAGKLNFVNGLLSVGAKIYLNVSKILSGEASVLFLFDAPEQFELLTVGGKLEMLFEGPDGDNVEFDFAEPLENPVAILTYPGIDETVFRDDFNENKYIEIKFLPSDEASFDQETILESHGLTLAGDAASNVTIDSVEKIADGKYRYHFSGEFGTGDVSVEIAAGSFSDSSGATNEDETFHFTVQDLTAQLAGPEDGGSIDVSALNNNRYISVVYIPSPGSQIKETSLNDDDVVFTLTFADGSTLDVRGPGTSVDNSYCYSLPDSFEFQPGEVTVEFKAGTWSDTSGRSNAGSVEHFIITGPTANLSDPLNGSKIDVSLLNERGYIDVEFRPTGGNSIVETSITGDNDVVFTITVGNEAPVEIRGPPAEDLGNFTYRYALPEDLVFVPGQVEVTFPAGSFADDAGYVNVEEKESFLVTGPAADLVETHDD